MKRALLAALLVLTPAPARAQNWSQSRGPRASGVAEGQKTPLKSDAPKSQNLAWKTPIPGLWEDKESFWDHGSSPVIHDNLVVIRADGHGQSFIAAYDLKTGRQARRVERNEITSWSTPTVVESGGRAEPVANGGRFIRAHKHTYAVAEGK